MYRSIPTEVLLYWIRLLRANADLRYCGVSKAIHEELKWREQAR